MEGREDAFTGAPLAMPWGRLYGGQAVAHSLEVPRGHGGCGWGTAGDQACPPLRRFRRTCGLCTRSNYQARGSEAVARLQLLPLKTPRTHHNAIKDY